MIGKSAPQEKTALGTGVFYFFGEFLVHFTQHKSTLLAVKLANGSNLLVKVIFSYKLVAYHLEKDIGMYVVYLLCNNYLLNDLLGSLEITYTHTCGKYLGEGGTVQNQSVLIKCLYGSNVLTCKAKLAVGIVLEYHYAVFFGNFVYLTAFLFGHGKSCGILEIGNNVNKLYLTLVLLNSLAQKSRVYTVILHRNAHKLCTVGTESVHGSYKAGIFAYNYITLVTKHLAHKVCRLLTACGYNELVSVGAHAEFFLLSFGKLLNQRRKSLCNAVLKSCRGALGVGEYLRRNLSYYINGKGGGIGVSARKGNNGGVCERFEYFTYSGGLKSAYLVGKFVFHDKFLSKVRS